jgi:hypothetical protein
MAKKVYYSETITGVANKEVLGNGITSTEAEPKRINKVSITVSQRVGNWIRIYIERERLADIIDYEFPLTTDTFRREIIFELNIPVGQTFKVGIACGGTASNLNVVYECEVG